MFRNCTLYCSQLIYFKRINAQRMLSFPLIFLHSQLIFLIVFFCNDLVVQSHIFVIIWRKRSIILRNQSVQTVQQPNEKKCWNYFATFSINGEFLTALISFKRGHSTEKPTKQYNSIEYHNPQSCEKHSVLFRCGFSCVKF